MLKEKLEKREQELQLEIVQVTQLKTSQTDFESEMESFRDDSEKKSGQINAFEA